jgi:spore germination protein
MQTLQSASSYLKSINPDWELPADREKAAQWLSVRRQEVPLSTRLDENQALLALLLKGSGDVGLRRIRIGGSGPEALLLSIDGMVDRPHLDFLMYNLLHQAAGATSSFAVREALLRSSLQAQTVRSVGTLGDVVQGVLSGDSALVIDGDSQGLILDTRGGAFRSIEEPQSEQVVRGPRDGFNESIRLNTALIRRRVQTPLLRLEHRKIGKTAKNVVVTAYVLGLADPDLVREVRHRLRNVDVDAALESGYLESYLEETPWTPFPTVKYSERPDSVAADLLEGRVAILLENTPIVLTVPTVFWDMLHSAEDAYSRFWIASSTRLLRAAFAVLALLGPSLWVAVVSYHQEVLPTSLMLTVLGSRESVPFPAFIEALLMELTFEAIREAGLRLPRQIGQAVSIVGALVIGQSAVEAGLVSPAMVIVVAVTGIANFMIPKYQGASAIRMLRFLFIALAGVAGAFGIFVGGFLLAHHMVGLSSFGVPYLSGFAPVKTEELKDTLLRAPVWALRLRPSFLNPGSRRRAGRRQA